MKSFFSDEWKWLVTKLEYRWRHFRDCCKYPRFPDVTPLYFFFCVYVKSSVYFLLWMMLKYWRRELNRQKLTQSNPQLTLANVKWLELQKVHLLNYADGLHKLLTWNYFDKIKLSPIDTQFFMFFFDNFRYSTIYGQSFVLSLFV